MRLDCVKRVRETIFVRDPHLEQKGREKHCLEELKWDLKRGRRRHLGSVPVCGSHGDNALSYVGAFVL